MYKKSSSDFEKLSKMIRVHATFNNLGAKFMGERLYGQPKTTKKNNFPTY